jgi:hypothetical protein
MMTDIGDVVVVIIAVAIVVVIIEVVVFVLLHPVNTNKTAVVMMDKKIKTDFFIFPPF